MRFFVGITDRDWFDHLSRLQDLDEVNFWQPSGNVKFRALQPGEPFLFKLHSPDDFIVGGGFFSHFTILPVSIVWKAFGEKNGAASEGQMRTRLLRYRKITETSLVADYDIGCILLESPFFFDRSDWIPLPGWRREIVRGKGYDSTGDGMAIWGRVETLLNARRIPAELEPVALEDDHPRFGEPITVFLYCENVWLVTALNYQFIYSPEKALTSFPKTRWGFSICAILFRRTLATLPVAFCGFGRKVQDRMHGGARLSQ